MGTAKPLHTNVTPKLTEVSIAVQPNGGYTVLNRGEETHSYAVPRASFSKKDDLLSWLSVNLAGPTDERPESSSSRG